MATVKIDKKLFTANFKRDYVAYSAVAIFALIVLSEAVLAVSIPLYFVRSSLWDLQIARQQLMSDFDSLRRFCQGMTPKNSDAEEENNILLWDLNLMANYLRANQKYLAREEISALSQDLTQIRGLAERLKQGQAFNTPIRLNADAFMAAVRTEFIGKESAQ